MISSQIRRVMQHKSATASIPATGDRRRSARPEMKRMVVPFEIKADSIDEEAGTFEGYASVWGLDLGDDVMHKGAFKNWIREWKASGEALPLLNSHNSYDIFSSLGQLLDVKEDDRGLWTKWELIDGEDGERVKARLRPSPRTGRSAVGKMSIGYEARKFDFEQSDAARYGQVRNLLEVGLHEVSLVIFPMAPDAAIDSSTVKQMIASAAATSPEDIEPELKADLRKLATRIGILLKPGKSSGDVAPPAPPAAPADGPAASDPPATEPPAPPAAPPAADPEDAGESTTEESGEKIYLFSEALQQKLLSLKLHAASHQTGNVQ